MEAHAERGPWRKLERKSGGGIQWSAVIPVFRRAAEGVHMRAAEAVYIRATEGKETFRDGDKNYEGGEDGGFRTGTEVGSSG